MSELLFFTFSNTEPIRSLLKSDLLFLRVGKLKTGLKNWYYTFWLCFYKKRAKEQFALFVKKTSDSYKKTKEEIPNPDIAQCVWV